MNSMNIHNIVSISLDPVEERVGEYSGKYTVRHMTFTDNEGKTFQLTLFGETIRNLVIRDTTLEELDEAANEEAEYYAELNRGYAQDRM